MNIRAVILDVDGVLLGNKPGFNSPWPNEKIIQKLKAVKKSGVAISLITARPAFAIEKILQDANLTNVHITDGGSVVSDPLKKHIYTQHLIAKEDVKNIVDIFLQNNIYTEIFTAEHYYIQKSQESEITERRSFLMQIKPVIVDDLRKIAAESDVVKIIPVALHKEHSLQIEALLSSVSSAPMYWAINSVTIPWQYGVITAPNISKGAAIQEVAGILQIPLEEMLGIGDSTNDWQFIQFCKYAGVVGNASDELKKLIVSKGDQNYFIGPSVDENGVLDILDFFIPHSNK